LFIIHYNSVCKGILDDIKHRVTGFAGDGDLRPIRDISDNFQLRIINRDEHAYCQANRQERLVIDNLRAIQSEILAQPFAFMHQHVVSLDVLQLKQMQIVERQAELKLLAERAGMQRKRYVFLIDDLIALLDFWVMVLCRSNT
jgi:hypothetical protein